VTREVLTLLQHAARRADCTMELQVAGEPVALHGSPARFGQVVTNLVTNAIDATPRSGRVALRLSRKGAGVEMEVKDTGAGIAPENLARIFDPLFTTKPFGQGTGLGLTIVHDIVTGEFGGQIAVASQIGRGTTFTLSLRPGQAS
jgi:signal transduction histidine kinase